MSVTDMFSKQGNGFKPGDRVVIAPTLLSAYGVIDVEEDLLFNRKPGLEGTVQDRVLGHEEGSGTHVLWVMQTEHDVFDKAKTTSKLAPYFNSELSLAP